MKAPANIHGKQFERDVNDAFYSLKIQHPVEWKRTIDSAGAGNIIGKADGDFELTINSGIYGCPYRFRIECKASIKHASLGDGFRELIKSHQNAQMILAMRAGIVGVYMYHDVRLDLIEIWHAKSICDHWPKKRVKFVGRPATTIAAKSLPLVAREWAVNPKEMMRQLLNSEV